MVFEQGIIFFGVMLTGLGAFSTYLVVTHRTRTMRAAAKLPTWGRGHNCMDPSVHKPQMGGGPSAER